jgi:hypothetical protein
MLSTVVKIMYRLYLRIVGFQKKKIRSINTKKKKKKKKRSKNLQCIRFYANFPELRPNAIIYSSIMTQIIRNVIFPKKKKIVQPILNQK